MIKKNREHWNEKIGLMDMLYYTLKRLPQYQVTLKARSGALRLVDESRLRYRSLKSRFFLCD